MEQKSETNYAESWLEKRNHSKPELDDDYMIMLAELNRGQQ